MIKDLSLGTFFTSYSFVYFLAFTVIDFSFLFFFGDFYPFYSLMNYFFSFKGAFYNLFLKDSLSFLSYVFIFLSLTDTFYNFFLFNSD